jgi:hypothetical protein
MRNFWCLAIDLQRVPSHDLQFASIQSTGSPAIHKYVCRSLLANPPEETKQMSILEHVTLLVPHGFHELEQPYGGICTCNMAG